MVARVAMREGWITEEQLQGVIWGDGAVLNLNCGGVIV